METPKSEDWMIGFPKEDQNDYSEGLCQVSSHLCIDQVHKGVASAEEFCVGGTWESQTRGFWTFKIDQGGDLHFQVGYGSISWYTWTIVFLGLPCLIHDHFATSTRIIMNHPHPWTGAGSKELPAGWISISWVWLWWLFSHPSPDTDYRLTNYRLSSCVSEI